MSENTEQFDLKVQWEALQKTNKEAIEAEAKGHADLFKKEVLANQEKAFGEMSDKINDLTAALQRKAVVADAVDEAKDAADEYTSKFDEWMRKGDEGLKNELTGLETKDLATSPANAAGNAVATPIQNAIGRILKASSPMRSLATVQSSSTGVYEKNFGQNDASSGWVAETAARPKTGTPTLEKVSITAFEQYAMPIITQTLLDDQYFNVEAWVAEEVAEQFARLENLAFASGTGSGQPNGFLNNFGVAGAGHAWGTYETIATATAGSPIGVLSEDDITALPYKMIADYRRGSKFVMNRVILSHVRSLKDSAGAYIWVPGFGSTPDTVLGYDVVEMEDMTNSLNTGEMVLAFGDFSKGYGIIDRVGMRMLRDPYTERPSIAYYTTKRVGGGVLDSNAIVGLELA